MYEGQVAKVVDEVVAELERATALHGPMSSPHEGYAVLQEKVDELWEEVKATPQDEEKMRAEAVQVAAMAIRFILDCCVEEEPAVIPWHEVAHPSKEEKV